MYKNRLNPEFRRCPKSATSFKPERLKGDYLSYSQNTLKYWFISRIFHAIIIMYKYTLKGADRFGGNFLSKQLKSIVEDYFHY